MHRQARELLMGVVVASVAACAEVLPTSPLEPPAEVDEEKEKLRELVEKVKARAREEEEARRGGELASLEIDSDEGKSEAGRPGGAAPLLGSVCGEG